jgi:hypothetical protein
LSQHFQAAMNTIPVSTINTMSVCGLSEQDAARPWASQSKQFQPAVGCTNIITISIVSVACLNRMRQIAGVSERALKLLNLTTLVALMCQVGILGRGLASWLHNSILISLTVQV